MNSIASTILTSVAVGGAGRAAISPPGSDPGASAPGTKTAAPPVPAPAPVAPAPDAAVSDASQQALDAAVKQIRNFIESSQSLLEFSIDQDSKRVLLRVMDPQTNQVILQIPSEEVLAIARALDRFQGLFLKQKA